jgi:hypothetical protein
MAQKLNTVPETKANSTWNHLEDFVRGHVQCFIEALLQEEVTELLGRIKSARRRTPSRRWRPDLRVALKRANQRSRESQRSRYDV